jgi:hypothetical protein
MSAVSEWIAREYFEVLGYLVSQPRKFTVPGRHKRAEEEVDLVVVNPTIPDLVLPERIVWRTEDFATVPRAVVAIHGWHTERFSTSTFDKTPDLLRFVQPGSLKFAAQVLGSDRMAKVLCLPRLPASGELKTRTMDFMRSKGIDGVISFSTMLAELVRRVEVNRNYEKSDILQMIRLLKNYGFLRDPQLEFFGRAQPPKRTAKSRKHAVPAHGDASDPQSAAPEPTAQ